MYFTLYVVVDIFSRYIVGWQVTKRESAVVAQELIEACCKKQCVTGLRPSRWSRPLPLP